MRPDARAAGMYEQRQLPELPTAYELRVLPAVDSVLECAAELAADGADEGTLVWAQSQRDARTRRGHPWQSPAGNLHCALVLRPDYDNAVAQQLCTIAAVAAGAGIAERVAPMTGLRFRWPGDLLINELLSGCIRMRAPAAGGDPWPWLVIGLSVNVAHHPPNPEPERYNSINASGDAGHVRALEVLEQFARHFLRWINIWAEEGYDKVRDAWLQRADVGETRELEFPSRRAAGTVLGIGDHGELLLDDGTGTPCAVTVAEYFDLR